MNTPAEHEGTEWGAVASNDQLGNLTPIEATDEDQAAAEEAFSYARFALHRHGYTLPDDPIVNFKLIYALLEHMKNAA